jgi:adenylate kinase
LLREEVRLGTYWGQQAAEVMRGGNLVPDKLMGGIILRRLKRDDCVRGFLLDGYPRNVEQAGLLDDILAESGRTVERAVLLEVAEEVSVARLCRQGLGRGQPNSSSMLAGNHERAVRERLGRYVRRMTPVVEFYRHRGQLLKVDGGQAEDQVADAVMQAVGAPVGA